MAFGLIVKNASGVTVLDSTLATGGVCVGIVTATPGAVYPFPGYAGRTGVVIPAQGSQDCMFDVTIDYSFGYPRFVFGSNAAGTVALFVK